MKQMPNREEAIKEWMLQGHPPEAIVSSLRTEEMTEAVAAGLLDVLKASAKIAGEHSKALHTSLAEAKSEAAKKARAAAAASKLEADKLKGEITALSTKLADMADNRDPLYWAIRKVPTGSAGERLFNEEEEARKAAEEMVRTMAGRDSIQVIAIYAEVLISWKSVTPK